MPTTPLGQAIRPAVRGVHRAFGALWQRQAAIWSSDTLICAYDLEEWPITYDFVWFLAAADSARAEQGLARCHVVLVGSRNPERGPESAEYLSVVDGPARRQRIYDMLLPATDLFASVSGVSVLHGRQDATLAIRAARGQVFPYNYDPAFPSLETPFPQRVLDGFQRTGYRPGLRPTTAALAWTENWRKAHDALGPVIVVTLRNYGYAPARNSNIAAWAVLARELEEKGYPVVFVPDTHSLLEGLQEQLRPFRVCVEAAWNLSLRAAFYERAHLNLSVSTGPASLFWFNPRSRYIMFKSVVADAPGTAVEAAMARGFDPRKPFAFAGPHQIVTDAPDTLADLRAFVYPVLDALASERATSQEADPTGLETDERPR